MRESLRVVSVVSIVAILLMGGLGFLCGSAYASSGTITRTQSGLVASDSLTTGNTNQWTFGGDAASQPGAKYTHSEHAQGLHIGVQTPAAGTWSGYYAVSGNTNAELFHAAVTEPYSSVPNNGFNTGIYVQTWNTDFIDYVGCLGFATPQGYGWTVVQAYGVVIGSQVINTLYQSPLNAMPTTEDCTIVTNGNNFLKVYLGGAVVVYRNNLTLNMPEPENAYLEPQTSAGGVMLNGTYTDYYATTSENVTVTGAPAGGTVEIVDAGVLSSAKVGSNGAAIVPVGSRTLPLSAVIEAFDSGGSMVASTGSAVTIWGGDAYAVSTVTSTTSTASPSVVTLTQSRATSGTLNLPPFQITIPNFNAGSGSSRLLVVGVSSNDYPISSVKFGSMSLSPVVTSFYNNDAELWFLLNPSGIANITVTMAGPSSVVVGADAFSGVDQTTPIPTTATNHNTIPGSPSLTITTKYANSLVVDLPSIYGGVTLGSPSCMPEWDINVPNAITGASSSKTVASPGSASCSWTTSGGGEMWDDVGIEIRAASVTTTAATTSTATGGGTGITVSAHRIYATYWDPCFATSCTNPTAPCNSNCTGPGASMYFELYDSAGNLIQSGYANENGYTFAGLTPGATYYVYPSDCDLCHNSPHDVVFQYWGNGSTTRPLAVTPGASLAAWYSCTNNCAGIGP